MIYELQSNGVIVEQHPSIQEVQSLFYKTTGTARIFEKRGHVVEWERTSRGRFIPKVIHAEPGFPKRLILERNSLGNVTIFTKDQATVLKWNYRKHRS